LEGVVSLFENYFKISFFIIFNLLKPSGFFTYHQV